MSVRISLTLEASEMFLSLHMIFSLERAAVVWAILERISGFDPSLEMTAPRYLKFSTSSSLWPFILISHLWKPFGLFVITFVLSGPVSILYLVVVLSRRSIRTPASSSSSAMTYDGVNDVSTFSQLFLIRFFLYLQVMRTCIKSRTSSNFGQIRPPTTELAALEHLKNFP